MFRTRMNTKRLLLRNWEAVDFEDFTQFCMDPEVMLASGAEPAKSKRQAKKDFEAARQDKECFAIVWKETGRAIGKIKFQEDIRRYRVNSISIGYELSKAYWGKGIMTEALKAMIQYAFEHKRVEVIGIGHFTVNSRSRRVIEKCGFKHEGTIPRAFKRFDGEVFDDEAYSILREDYLANQHLYKD